MKRRQLKWSMIAILTACWFIPLLLISAVMLFLVSGKMNGQLKNTIETSADSAIEISNMRLADAMTASRNASYNPTIRDSYYQYLKDGDRSALHHVVTLFLAEQYKYNTDFKSTLLYFVDDPDTLYFAYSNIAGATYKSVSDYEKYAKKEIQEAAKELDTYIGFMKINGRLYMVRNLVTSRFEPYAVLVMELNAEEIWDSLKSVWGYSSANVFLDGEPVLGSWAEDWYADALEGDRFYSMYMQDRKAPYVYQRGEFGGYKMTYAILLDKDKIVDQTNSITLLAILFGLFMIPLIAIVFIFFHRKVTLPIQKLTDAYGKIEKEEYGYHIATENVEEEFYYLNQAFNRMSDKLKYQFEKIYLEELALRDANIMALQSQINPHFLNNTLEIINWEARMTENFKVSRMIEALSTMLEATMNRGQESTISLQEEINYVDAYLYIIKERFGENFHVEKEIDEKLLQTRIPRLIIQPIVENAIEHGMDMRKGGRVRLRVFEEKGFVHIEVWDNGRLTDEERDKIEHLLSGENAQDYRSLSLGIRNVNKRLKIMYGEECGLTIKSDKENHTVSTLLVKIDK